MKEMVFLSCKIITDNDMAAKGKGKKSCRQGWRSSESPVMVKDEIY